MQQIKKTYLNVKIFYINRCIGEQFSTFELRQTENKQNNEAPLHIAGR